MKFLRFRDGNDTLQFRPASTLLGISNTVDGEVQLFFQDDANAQGNSDYLELSVTNNKEKEVIETIVEAIYYGPNTIVTIADEDAGEFIHSEIDAVVGIVSNSDTDPA